MMIMYMEERHRSEPAALTAGNVQEALSQYLTDSQKRDREVSRGTLHWSLQQLRTVCRKLPGIFLSISRA